jgi:histidinol-phosphate aminotransferase
MVTARQELIDLSPYQPGKPMDDVKREYGLKEVIKLASNENPLGCSPRVKDAMGEIIDIFQLYPDGNCTALKEALAQKFNISTKEVMPTSGSDEMVDLIAKTYINKDDEVIMANITFPRYITVTKMMGAIPKIIPLKNLKYDLEAMAVAITNKTKLIWLCNPNNPTGTYFSEDELINFMNKVSKDTLVVYDEAYNEYVTTNDYPKNSIDLFRQFPNMLIMRTFSKIYGLASLRIGYTIAREEILTNIDKIRNPFNVNTMAQIAAKAALQDQDFVAKSYMVNKEGKEFLYQEFEKLGLKFAPSEANHIWVDTGMDGILVFNEMQKRGVIIRPMPGTNIRVSIGTMEQNKVFIDKLKEVLNM